MNKGVRMLQRDNFLYDVMDEIMTLKNSILSIIAICCILMTSGILYAEEANIPLNSHVNSLSELEKESKVVGLNQPEQAKTVAESEALSLPNRSEIATLKAVYKNNFDDNFVGKIIYPDWFHQSDFMNYQEDLSEAVEEGKKGAFLLFTAQGCPYCDKFIKLSLGDADIAKQLQKYFMPTGLEIFSDIEIVNFQGDEMPTKEFAKKVGVQFTPTLIFYDEVGQQVFKAIGYRSSQQFQHILNYVMDKHYLTQDLHTYVKQQSKKNYQPSMADQLISGLYEETVATTLFEHDKVNFDPNTEAVPRPLVVLFEEDNCQDCLDFNENILSVKAVRELLKQFQMVKFKASDNKTALIKPDKTTTTPAKWVKALNFQHFPALVFFDAKGRQVLQTDSLLRKRRMLYSCQYVLENAFDKGWSYQRFGRFKEGERRRLASEAKERSVKGGRLD
jgi:thioredoxin-related protein